jgi:hypothetical protein
MLPDGCHHVSRCQLRVYVLLCVVNKLREKALCLENGKREVVTERFGREGL